ALTAFYMVRLYCLTFLGENRADHHTKEHLHETSPIMWAPLMVLAVLSIAGGWLGIPEVLGGHNFLHHYFEPVFQIPPAAQVHWQSLTGERSHALELGLMAASTGLALAAAFLSCTMYRKGPSPKAATIAGRYQMAYKTLLNKYYVGEFYFARVVK